MALEVNQDLLLDDDAPVDGKLPDGIFYADEWDQRKESKTLPVDRVELFRVNGKVYTAPKSIDNRAMFKYMKSVRQSRGQDDILPIADLMYEVLGDAVMDALATEKLSDEEFKIVMKVVEKHTAGMARNTLGK